MKKLYFIRHGESLGNLKRLFTGQWDVPLTELGQQQARAATQNAQNLQIECIVSSPLIRARQTAEIIAAAIGYPKDKILYSDLFMERNYGDWQQQSYEVADGKDFEKVPNIELEAHLLKRASQAADYLKNIKTNNVLVVGHGTQGRVLQQEIFNRHTKQIEVPIKDEIPNAQIIEWL